MPYYDELFKHVTETFPGPLAALALKTSAVKVGDPVNTEHFTVRVHHSDMTFYVEFSGEEAIWHIEAQTDDSRHKPMPLRMLAYSSFLALEHERNVYSTVLYFRPPAGQNDPGFYGYGNAERGGVSFYYNVIRIYELAGEAFLDAEAIGLLPFTALMKPPPDLSPEAWVEKCIETTQSAPVDREMRGTLLFGLSLFGSLVHPPELFQDSTLEAIMGESPFYDYVMGRGEARGEARGREQGIAQGAKEATVESTLAILNERFPTAEVTPVRSVLEAIGDLDRLKRLNLQASIASSFRAFQEHLDA